MCVSYDEIAFAVRKQQHLKRWTVSRQPLQMDTLQYVSHWKLFTCTIWQFKWFESKCKYKFDWFNGPYRSIEVEFLTLILFASQVSNLKYHLVKLVYVQCVSPWAWTRHVFFSSNCIFIHFANRLNTITDFDSPNWPWKLDKIFILNPHCFKQYHWAREF